MLLHSGQKCITYLLPTAERLIFRLMVGPGYRTYARNYGIHRSFHGHTEEEA